MLRRNLIYTAITRGRKLVVLVGQIGALHSAASDIRMTPCKRHQQNRSVFIFILASAIIPRDLMKLRLFKSSH